ncbi:MAG: peptidylprolyl isomerase [Rhodospirillaceae bacterium]
MNLRPLLSVALLGLAFGGWVVAPAVAGDAAAIAVDPVVARVNGSEIHRSEVVQTLSNLPPQVRQMPPEMVFPAVLEQLVNTKLVVTAAIAAKVSDEPDFKEKLKRAEERVMQEVYLTRAVKTRITEDMLKARYKKFQDENPPQDEVRASHILVATEAEAKALLEQLKAGADFAKLSKEKSTDTAAAAQGGDLGWFSRDAMVQPFSEAAFKGTPGKVIETPVHTQFGWHVIRVDERRKSTPPALDDMRSDLENEMSQEVVQAVVGELRSKAQIEEFSMDGSPKAKP